MRRNRSTIEFHHPYESLIWLARRNDSSFCEKAALNLYREALAAARSDDERQVCEAAIKRLSAKP
jgi:hypothetical protein